MADFSYLVDPFNMKCADQNYMCANGFISIQLVFVSHAGFSHVQRVYVWVRQLEREREMDQELISCAKPVHESISINREH